MKRVACLTLLAAATSWACGGDVQEPPQQEAPPVQEGVFGLAPGTAQGVPSVVSLRPSGGGSADVPPEPVVMDQLGLAFTPWRLSSYA